MTNPNDFAFNDSQTHLTKREYIAAMAMQGMLANNSTANTIWDYAILAKHSLLATDELINALNKQQ